ncbi:hypothetical protein GGR26_002405 [Lewinella marina]|uniref:Pirin family protein n=1 Tax=Neolewinella marina TaxID=438751 RepID=A0A2G0CBY4_9BACT|nr:pirin family protein [Neolewinella marina]NJB86628.1 hypothetical protein [Neolewinella marina]PHK97437.1 hypothetical protein CGL56_15165 [Neolewinella marina]
MKTIYHPAASRGYANHGWLSTHHSFSFARYYNPERMQFGALRVLNDDEVAGGRGFGSHPHDNMEIVSIPLEGDLEHQDSMGNTTVIREGDVQVMSAGTGVVHSEKNRNPDRPVKFLQIWVFPRERNVEPRYDQETLDTGAEDGRWHPVVTPEPQPGAVWMHQDAWFSIGRFAAGTTTEYTLNRSGNGVYLFVLEGSATVNGQTLNRRDALGVTEADGFTVDAGTQGARILAIEVPME